MNQFKKQILIGTIIGNASLQTYTNGKSWRVRFLETDNNKEYLFHLYENVFKEYVNTQPRFFIDQFGNKKWFFNTIVSTEFNYFADLFYIKKKSKWVKHINPNIINILTPLSLYYLFLDLGSFCFNGNSNKIVLAAKDPNSLGIASLELHTQSDTIARLKQHLQPEVLALARQELREQRDALARQEQRDRCPPIGGYPKLYGLSSETFKTIGLGLNKRTTPSIIFNTETYTLKDVKILGEAIKKISNIHVSFQRNKLKQYRIYISKSQFETFRLIINPWI